MRKDSQMMPTLRWIRCWDYLTRSLKMLNNHKNTHKNAQQSIANYLETKKQI